MTKNEIDEIFEKLRQSGLDPQLCDTAVPYFANGVPAGYPEAPGDYDGEMALIPRAFLRECSFIVSVHGDSMKDAGICPKCGGHLIERNGKYGSFYGCSNYPRCRFTTDIQ